MAGDLRVEGHGMGVFLPSRSIKVAATVLWASPDSLLTDAGPLPPDIIAPQPRAEMDGSC